MAAAQVVAQPSSVTYSDLVELHKYIRAGHPTPRALRRGPECGLEIVIQLDAEGFDNEEVVDFDVEVTGDVVLAVVVDKDIDEADVVADGDDVGEDGAAEEDTIGSVAAELLIAEGELVVLNELVTEEVVDVTEKEDVVEDTDKDVVV